MSVRLRTPECFPHRLSFLSDREYPPLGHDRCPGGSHQPGVIGGWDCACPCHHNGGKPPTPQLFACDWGGCDDEAVDSRWSVALGWLPVCATHREPAYVAARDAAPDTVTP